jgi:hypothetical protein
LAVSNLTVKSKGAFMRIVGAVLIAICALLAGCGTGTSSQEVQPASCGDCTPGCSGCRGDCGGVSQPVCGSGASGVRNCSTCRCDEYTESCPLPSPCAPGLVACPSDCDGHVYCTSAAVCAYCKRRGLCTPPTCP